MTIYVFFRSKEFSNSIAASAKACLEKRGICGLNVEFFNLDKRNYQKILKLAEAKELPKYIYIWYDEEKIGDYIKETYPNIEVIHFDKNSATFGQGNYYGYKVDYLLADQIVKVFYKENLKKRNVYLVKDYKKTLMKLDDIEIQDYYARGYRIFEESEKADQYIKDSIESHLIRKKKELAELQKEEKELKKDIKTMETKLVKIEGGKKI